MAHALRTATTALMVSTLLALPFSAAPAAAQEVQRTDVLSLCGSAGAEVDADATTTGDGRTTGFAAARGSGCSTDIWAFRGAGARWETARSPYRGLVLAVGADTTGTYLLYQGTDGVRLGKQTTSGAFEPSRHLSPQTAGVTGAVAGHSGAWWAVWSEATGTYGQEQLYQAKTFAGHVTRQRITNHAFMPDREPSLTLQPGAGGARLLWTRYDAPVEPDSSDIWEGTSSGGAWSFRALFTAGSYNHSSDLYSDRASFVGFVRDQAPAYADNASGSFGVSVLPRPAGTVTEQPHVGAATGRSYLGWLAARSGSESVVVATRRDGGWFSQTLDTGPPGSRNVHAVVGSGLHGGTVVYSVGGVLRAASTNDCVYGAIGQRYASLGGPDGFLRFPNTCELPTPIRPGRYNHFQGGSIYWSSPTGAWEVHGEIRLTWARLGWENSAVGFPVTNELRTPDKPGAFNHFERGSIYWSPATGAREVRGAIRGRWAGMGWENSLLGFPQTNETRTPDKPGAFNHFQGPGSGGGSIYWSPTTGAHEVYGAIRTRWASLGWENSRLGFPVTGEYGVPGGRRSDFQGGSITWTPGGGAVVTYS